MKWTEEERKEKQKERSKTWYQENKEKIKVRQKVYYQKNKEKVKITLKAWYQKRKKEYNWVEDLKRKQGCLICGEDNPLCLDFDHIDPTIKEYNISVMISKHFSKEAIELEISKCRVLCSNCHRIKTANVSLDLRKFYFRKGVFQIGELQEI